MSPARIVSLIFPIFLIAALAAGCSNGEAITAAVDTVIVSTVEATRTAAAPTAVPTQPLPTPTAVPAGVPTQPSATQPVATAMATPGAPPASSTGIQFKPAQMAQGGTSIVYLNEQATSATVTFGGRQYPMLQSGGRWWAMIGVGAFAELGLAPVSISYMPVGRTTPVSVVASIAIVDREYPVESITLDPDTAALLAPEIVQAELNKRASIYGNFTTERLWSGPFLRPNPSVISSTYGVGRSYNGGPVTDYHRGTDFAGQLGDPVVAAARGRVAFAGELRVRGNTVVLDHGAGVFTAYHHFSAIKVSEGQIVNAGDLIGLIGSTGLVDGPHLHWEVIVRGVEVDGELWLKGTEVGP